MGPTRHFDPLAHEVVAHLDALQSKLGLFGAVLDQLESRDISLGQLSEHAGIKLIALALVLVDGSQLAKFGDESIATQINKESAIQPGEMDRSARDVLRGSDAAIKSRGC